MEALGNSTTRELWARFLDEAGITKTEPVTGTAHAV